MVKKELLGILACPICKGDIEEKGDWIICRNCCKKYPISEGIPVMLIDEAKPLEEGEC